MCVLFCLFTHNFGCELWCGGWWPHVPKPGDYFRLISQIQMYIPTSIKQKLHINSQKPHACYHLLCRFFSIFTANHLSQSDNSFIRTFLTQLAVIKSNCERND